MRGFALLALAAACQQGIAAAPCTVLCSAEDTCPSGLACAADGYCHPAGDGDDCSTPEPAPDAAEPAPDAAEPPPEVTPPVVFSCPPGAAVGTLTADGRPGCRPLGPDGLVPAFLGANQFSCPPGYLADSQYFPAGGSTNEATVFACFLDGAGISGSDPSYRHPSLGALSCPRGAHLRGFAPNGAAVCRADASVPVGFGVSGYQEGGSFACPPGYEIETHHRDSGNDWNATWSLCRRSAADAELDSALAGPFGDSSAVGLCPGFDIVIGFRADGSAVCEAPYGAGVPAGFGMQPIWDHQWTSNSFTCPPGHALSWLSYDCGCNRNAVWPGCYGM
jgi:hypothetical protein